jgi:hypothetical protein
MTRTMTIVFALAWTMTANVAHAAMQKGDVVPVAAETSLKTRPTPDAEALAPAPAGASATLSVRISNTSGDWWYVEIDGKKGWLPESALAAAPAPASAPAAPTAAVEAPAPAAAPAVAAIPVAAAQATPVPVEKPVASRRSMTAAGSKELALAFEYAKDSGDFGDTRTLGLDLKYGYCFSDTDEFGAQVQYVKLSEDEFSVTDYVIGPFYTHNVPSQGDVVPFFSLMAGLAKSDFDGIKLDGRVFEASGGVRLFKGADFAVNFAAYYRKTDQEYEGFDLAAKTVGARIGVSGFIR